MLSDFLLKKQAKNMGKVTEVITVVKPIKKVSEKRKVDQREYRKIVKEMLAENPNCEIKEQGCEGKASGLHHQKKRTPATLLDKRFLIRSCSSCNLWVELHPLEAIEKGHSISKFKK